MTAVAGALGSSGVVSAVECTAFTFGAAAAARAEVVGLTALVVAAVPVMVRRIDSAAPETMLTAPPTGSACDGGALPARS
jgi:hypothetical protein